MEKFKKSQLTKNALHSRFHLITGDPVYKDDEFEHLQVLFLHLNSNIGSKSDQLSHWLNGMDLSNRKPSSNFDREHLISFQDFELVAVVWARISFRDIYPSINWRKHSCRAGAFPRIFC